MHLQRLELANFRSCANTVAYFQPDLTVLVGENNSGKSNIIDALRLITSPTDGRRTRYPSEADVNSEADDNAFSIRGVYGGMDAAQQGLFIAASDGLQEDTVSFSMRYDAPLEFERRGRVTLTVGRNDSVDPEPAARDRIRHVYLPPMRDAEVALSSSNGERIEFVLRALAADGEVEALESTAASAYEDLRSDPLLSRMNATIDTTLGDLTRAARTQSSDVGFVEPRLRQLARSLRAKLGESGIALRELTQSGLGYANLLFLSTVLVELEATRDADLILFLVEEPEAHLHPQLQGAILSFLRQAAQRNNHNERTTDIQVIVTTHSAQLAAAVESKHIQVVKRSGPDASHAADATCVVPVWRLGLSDHQRGKVDRYINATRSPLLFGPRALLVEGLAEALLLPSIARIHLATAAERAKFNGVALVAIDGVDFEPYLRLLLTTHNGARVADKVVVITDKDPSAPGDRVQRLRDLVIELGASESVAIEAADITLEASLCDSGNIELLRRAFLAQRPRLEDAWQDAVANTTSPGQAVVDLFRDKRISKGELAQHLAGALDGGQTFTTPSYLASAISAVIA